MNGKTRKRVLLGCMISFIFSCNTKEEEPSAAAVDKEQIKKEIQAKEDEFAATYNAGILKDIGYFADDATSFYQNRPALVGKEAIIEFLKRKWAKELDYCLMKELWCYNKNRISVRFEYEWRDADNPSQWMRTHGNEHWEFEDSGLMRIRDMSANDYPIKESERKYRCQ